MTHYSGDPRQIKAKFTGVCHTCGKKISKGEEIIGPRTVLILEILAKLPAEKSATL